MKVALLLLPACIGMTNAFCQGSPRPGDLYAGISFGINYSHMAPGNADPANVAQLNTVNGLGYRLGLLGGLKFSRQFAFELKPVLAFNDSKLGIVRPDMSHETYGQSVTVEGTGHLVYKGGRGHIAPVIMAGVSYRQPLGSAQSPIIEMMRPSVALDAGIGMEKRFRQFSLQPELRYAYGLSNFTAIRGLSTLHMHTFIFAVNFKK